MAGFFEFRPTRPDLTAQDGHMGRRRHVAAVAAGGGEAFRSRRQEWNRRPGIDGATRTNASLARAESVGRFRGVDKRLDGCSKVADRMRGRSQSHRQG